MPTKKKKTKLTVRQAAKFAAHSKHHTKKHLALMKRLMLEGKTFNQSHMIAMRRVGK